MTKFIVVTGGVLSGLGKGIAAASIGHLLTRYLRVIPIKCDGYLNTDPGTMNPIEHGEVFVLDDGGEVDMDFGHYERFLNVTCKFSWNLTMGKVFKSILEKERRGDFLGKTVQFIPHVTDEIKSIIRGIVESEKADIGLIEIGGTVGDLENEFFIEAVRQISLDMGQENFFFVHLTYVPMLSNTKEQKSKPTQQSVKLLNERGIRPDVVITRSKAKLNKKIREKIALFCNISPNAVIDGHDVETVYGVPILYDEQGLTELIHKKLHIYSPPELSGLKTLVKKIKRPKHRVKIAICGKYTRLQDSYASIIEALIHSGAHLDVKPEIIWLETTNIETGETSVEEALKGIDGIIVPGGFGTRGIEGKIKVIKYAREHNIPFLGICYGMQLAVIEFARNVCGLEGANTTEVESDGVEVKHPVIFILPDKAKEKNYGGTLRRGGYDVSIKQGTILHKIYGERDTIRERFRHRYEVNPEYVPILEKHGAVFSGYSKTEGIMQAIELPFHQYFVGTQFHPELISKLEKPAPLFYYLIKNALERKGSQIYKK